MCSCTSPPATTATGFLLMYGGMGLWLDCDISSGGHRVSEFGGHLGEASAVFLSL